MRWFLVALAGGLALGCGDSADDEESVDSLTCAWLEGNNCWKTMLSGAIGCLPAESDTGVLAADGSSCTYGSGHIVTFDEPLSLPLADEALLRFTLTANGQQCLRYVETERTMTVTVGGDQTFEQTSTGLGLRFTCPDGSSVSNDNAFDLLECREDLLAAIALMPGYSYGSGNTSISFGLLGYSEEQALSIFSCSR